MTTNINHQTSPIPHRHVSTNILISLNQKKKVIIKQTRVLRCCDFCTRVGPTLSPRVSRTLLVKCVSRGAHIFLIFKIFIYIYIFFDNVTEANVSQFLNFQPETCYHRFPLISNTHLPNSQSQTGKKKPLTTGQAEIPVTKPPRVERRNGFNRSRSHTFGDAGL